MRVEELANRSHHVTLLLIGQLGIDGQRQRFSFAAASAMGKSPGFVAQRSEARLQMQRYGIVDLGADLARSQVVAKRVADGSRHADGVLVEDVIMAFPLARQSDRLRQSVSVE